MNTNTHPIEFFIASLLYLFEGICYIINEIAGFHSQPATTTPKASATVSTKPTEPLARPSIQPLFTELASLTKRQLQTLTGIRSSRYNKLQLLSIAAAYA